MNFVVYGDAAKALAEKYELKQEDDAKALTAAVLVTYHQVEGRAKVIVTVEV